MAWRAPHKTILGKPSKPKTEEEKTEGGVFIPATANTVPDNSFVAVYVGEEVDEIEPGQTFLVSPLTAASKKDSTLKVDDEELIIFNSSNILLIED